MESTNDSAGENGFTSRPEENRFEMAFDGGKVWADYARSGEVLSILHVEAEPQLRGSGAAGRFMAALGDHARSQQLKLRPICGYAAAWLRRHRDYHDVLAG